MADEHSLNFFHGALLDEDADVFLVQDGDYLIQAKPDRRFGPPKLILAVKKGQTKVRRIDIVKIEGAGYRFMGKSYADLQQLINKFSTHPLELANGDTILLKRPIPKGKFSFIHKDIRLQRKIHSAAYGTVYKGVMVKDSRPIIVKRIDSDGKDDQALIDMMKEARENDPNFYGLIYDRLPYLLIMHDISAIQSTNICRESPSNVANNIVKEPEIAAVNNDIIPTKKPSTNSFLPEEIKSEFLTLLGTSEANIAQNESLMKWLGEKVLEMVESKIGKIDEIVREKVAKEKLEIETRFRVQIQEMKDEMDAAQKKQEEAQARCEQLQEQLTQKIKDLEEAQRLAVPQTGSIESDSNICSSIYSQSTSNGELTNDSELSPKDSSDLQNNSLSTNCRESKSNDVDMESSTSNDSVASSLPTAVQAIFKEYDFNRSREWDLSLPGEERYVIEYDDSSLSSIGSSRSNTEDQEEINVDLSPRYYNDINSSDEEKINKYRNLDLDYCCRTIADSLTNYWRIVRQLYEERQKIIRILKKRLQPFLWFNDDEEVDRVNVTIEQCESLLNSYFPIVPKWKATYQKDTDKKIIIRKGYIYKRTEETDDFQCTYPEKNPGCSSFIIIDDSDTLVEGSFCFHTHPAADNEEYTEDVPPPPEAPISLLRVTKEGDKSGKYDKLVEFLDQTSIKLLQWQKQAMLCEKRINLVKHYINQLQAVELPNNKRGYHCKMVVAETNNLLNCIRLDKQYP